ncbi:unnamed protein product [Spirodela intermedia]|uniref:Uncharacterized protein n=2 Tax=Spirodela intermedia TaxID=51605 RepID=A0A7I8KC20_SPIIN|nr:unnamed protein product [Spirodela intermedia]CAA6658965.1 unnamed protein product [Spirodela intermedia]CAA7395251.1 unnamed protein product [Spirodela intermedia]
MSTTTKFITQLTVLLAYSHVTKTAG